MVNLGIERASLLNDKKSFLPSRTNSVLSQESQNSAQANEVSSSFGSESASQLAGGVVRKAIHSPKPHYPFVSRQLREEGLVMVKLCVNEQGIVGEVGISKSSGFQNLDHAALKALSSWRFNPIALNTTKYSAQCFQTPVQFTLEG